MLLAIILVIVILTLVLVLVLLRQVRRLTRLVGTGTGSYRRSRSLMTSTARRSPVT